MSPRRSDIATAVTADAHSPSHRRRSPNPTPGSRGERQPPPPRWWRGPQRGETAAGAALGATGWARIHDGTDEHMRRRARSAPSVEAAEASAAVPEARPTSAAAPAAEPAAAPVISVGSAPDSAELGVNRNPSARKWSPSAMPTRRTGASTRPNGGEDGRERRPNGRPSAKNWPPSARPNAGEREDRSTQKAERQAERRGQGQAQGLTSSRARRMAAKHKAERQANWRPSIRPNARLSVKNWRPSVRPNARLSAKN